ncbi:MAG: nitroreductase family protein [Firmicutes bacterium]|nr:nitroreductase family protein [Bacillota bacterium]
MERDSMQAPLCTSNIDVITAIRDRRSIRRYTAESVDEATLHCILQAGLAAPTAMNRRPFHFVVLRERDTLAQLAAGKKYAWMLSDAPCAIAILGDKAIENRPEHLYADCFAATQNMLLAIHALKLGGVWIGVSVDSEWYELLQEVLKLPENIIPTAVISLGHPAEARPVPDTWEPEKIHYETWQGK